MNRQKTDKQTAAENKPFYALQKFENSADIYIFGDICEFSWWEEDVTPTGIVKEIKDLDVSQINVHIDSYGGAVSGGWAIYNALKQHKAKITTYADGFVCSAALYPFLAGDERYASNVSGFYLHEVSTGAWGYAEDLRAAAEEAEKLTEIGINAFEEIAGMNRDTVKQLMEAETWLTPQEALSYNIATAVITKAESGEEQSALKAILQKIMTKTPESAPAAAEQEGKEQPEQKTTKENTELPENKPETQPENSLMKAVAGIFNVNF